MTNAQRTAEKWANNAKIVASVWYTESIRSANAASVAGVASVTPEAIALWKEAFAAEEAHQAAVADLFRAWANKDRVNNARENTNRRRREARAKTATVA